MKAARPDLKAGVRSVGTPGDMSLIVVDDDAVFAARLGQALTTRGFDVRIASSVRAGLALIAALPSKFAVFDLRLPDGSGIDLVEALRKRRTDARALVLTGYGNIATAVSAAKFGAVDFLAKPSDADQILAALLAIGTTPPPPPEVVAAPRDVRLAHIQSILQFCNNNISQAARQLGMHRRTLQRIVHRTDHDEKLTDQ